MIIEIFILSQNLINTINVYQTDNGWAIDIPAECYDISLYNKKGIIVKTGKGSYAQSVDKSGGFSKTHKNFISCSFLKQTWLFNGLFTLFC